MPQIDVFETTLQKSNEWLRDIATLMGWDRPKLAYSGLRAVLHAVRDRLPIIEAVHLGAQLPMLLRGLYYEGWSPAGKPLKLHRDEFLTFIQDQFSEESGIDPVRVARSVLDVMVAHIDPGELSKVMGLFPREFADLWPSGAIA